MIKRKREREKEGGKVSGKKKEREKKRREGGERAFRDEKRGFSRVSLDSSFRLRRSHRSRSPK